MVAGLVGEGALRMDDDAVLTLLEPETLEVDMVSESVGERTPSDEDGIGSHSVELELWEQDKENVKPDRAGRNPNVLAEIFAKGKQKGIASGFVTVGERDERQAEFEEHIQAATVAAVTSEPAAGTAEVATRTATSNAVALLVQLWSDYARWAAEWYPTGSREERAVLERATSALAQEPRAWGDARYLALWLRLADLLHEPQEVFNYLWANDVGTCHAMFYEAWARSLERQSRVDEAREVLSVGLARHAEPMESLQACRKSLELRVQERIRRQVQNSEFQNFDGFGCERLALNVITADEALKFERPTTERRGSTQHEGFGFGAASLPRPFPACGAPKPLSCLDEADATPRASIFDARADWRLPPVAEVSHGKENQRTPNTHLRQHFQCARSSHVPPALGHDAPTALAVFVDAEFDDASQAMDATDVGFIPSGDREAQRRRPRMAEQPSAGDELAGGISSLRLNDGPPAKRVCVYAEDECQHAAPYPRSGAFTTEAAAGPPGSASVVLQTPPRRPDTLARAHLVFGEVAVVRGRSPPLRDSTVRHVELGSNRDSARSLVAELDGASESWRFSRFGGDSADHLLLGSGARRTFHVFED